VRCPVCRRGDDPARGFDMLRVERLLMAIYRDASGGRDAADRPAEKERFQHVMRDSSQALAIVRRLR
jgi:hypothetical protein